MNLEQLLAQKQKKAIYCLWPKCNKFLRWGHAWEQPVSGARASHWFCCKQHFQWYAALHGQAIRPYLHSTNQFNEVLERIQENEHHSVRT